MASMEEKIILIKSILAVNAKTGANAEDIRREFFDLTNEKLGSTLAEAIAILEGIPDIYKKDGFWFSKSRESSHIAKFVKEQNSKIRRPMPIYNPAKRTRFNSFDSDRPRVRSYLYDRTNQRPESNYVTSQSNGRNSTYDRNRIIYDSFDSPHSSTCQMKPPIPKASNSTSYEIIADDFFFSLFLEYNLFRSTNEPFGSPNISWSYCVSGQTIQDAISNIRLNHNKNDSHVIINIGMADLCRGENYCKMTKDFVELMDICHEFKMNPVVTTLLSFGLSNVSYEMYYKVHIFNKFLINNFSNVIDLWNCFSFGLSRFLLAPHLKDDEMERSTPKSNFIWEKNDLKLLNSL